ncbi:MAG: sigma-70 family RNA polymerase sigma factor [Alphaproteobacteria bacterium]|jgi:RNA polymerase sigma-70 factor (ECF subfamily)|nr:sigma-70 family RNA polymerase sigma factor [Alphaproteobacteria bacterium]
MSADPLQDSQSDEALLAAYARGERDAARALSRRLLPRVLGQAQRMLGDRAEAEDVAQEAMLRLWRIAPDWEADRAKVTTWLYRVVANLCTDRLRKSGRGVALDAVPEPADTGPSVAAGMQDRDRHMALRAALADLPERQARAVALRHLEDLPNPEVARIMGESVRTVESLVARGKKGLIARLRGRKAELGYDDDR